MSQFAVRAPWLPVGALAVSRTRQGLFSFGFVLMPPSGGSKKKNSPISLFPLHRHSEPPGSFIEPELELMQSQMAQKQKLRGDVGARPWRVYRGGSKLAKVQLNINSKALVAHIDRVV